MGRFVAEAGRAFDGWKGIASKHPRARISIDQAPRDPARPKTSALQTLHTQTPPRLRHAIPACTCYHAPSQIRQKSRPRSSTHLARVWTVENTRPSRLAQSPPKLPQQISSIHLSYTLTHSLYGPTIPLPPPPPPPQSAPAHSKSIKSAVGRRSHRSQLPSPHRPLPADRYTGSPSTLPADPPPLQRLPHTIPSNMDISSLLSPSDDLSPSPAVPSPRRQNGTHRRWPALALCLDHHHA